MEKLPGSIPVRGSGVEALQQANGLVGTLRSGSFQPVASLQRLTLTRLAVVPAKLQLGPQIARAGRLAQQLQADAPITGIAALAAQNLTQTALGNHHALTRRLLEQAPGNTLDAGVMAQTRTVKQPESQAQRQTLLWRRLRRTDKQDARLHVSIG